MQRVGTIHKVSGSSRECNVARSSGTSRGRRWWGKCLQWKELQKDDGYRKQKEYDGHRLVPLGPPTKKKLLQGAQLPVATTLDPPKSMPQLHLPGLSQPEPTGATAAGPFLPDAEFL